MAAVRVVVADDDARFREFLSTLIDETPGMVCVGAAADGIEALQQVERHLPDVVVLDIDMPRLDGAEAARMIMERRPEIAVVLISGLEVADIEFVRKAAAEADLIDAISQAAAESRRLRIFRI